MDCVHRLVHTNSKQMYSWWLPSQKDLNFCGFVLVVASKKNIINVRRNIKYDTGFIIFYAFASQSKFLPSKYSRGELLQERILSRWIAPRRYSSRGKLLFDCIAPHVHFAPTAFLERNFFTELFSRLDLPSGILCYSPIPINSYSIEIYPSHS